MNKLLKRLKRREGFTLVECIVAVAVFAVMVMLVFMILTNARNEAVNANKAEEDLTKLIDNVVSDETYRKYDTSGSATPLHLTVVDVSGNTKDFDITYNTIDGYKNFVICDYVDPTTHVACNYFADNADFMSDPATFAQTPYACPKCGYNNIIQELVCEECNQTGDHIDTTKFVYIPENGGYACLECGGTIVRGTNIDDFVDANAKLSVSGIVPNAITYGHVEKVSDTNELVKCYQADGTTKVTGQNVQVFLTYNENLSTPGTSTKNSDYIAGTYTMRVVASSAPSAGVAKVSVQLPDFYKVASLTEKMGTCAPTDGIKYNSNGKAISQPGYLVFDLNGGTQAEATFQLVNYKSGFSFEYDYFDSNDSNTGLANYWFGMGSSVTHGSNGYVDHYNGQKMYTSS